jgi:predicted dehydrogenase
VFANFVRTHSHYCKIVAVAEPRPQTRQAFAKKSGVPAENVFASHTELLAASDALIKQGKPRIAMAVIICVQDRMHAEFTIEFARRGFHVLCEKPLGVDIQECITVADEVEKAGIVFALGHSKQETYLAFKFTSDSIARFSLLHICIFLD